MIKYIQQIEYFFCTYKRKPKIKINAHLGNSICNCDKWFYENTIKSFVENQFFFVGYTDIVYTYMEMVLEADIYIL